MKQVLVIVGPTAIGKTALSIELARILDGEIISGDSVQIYQALNIGSAKITKEEMQGIPHYLMNDFTLEKEYSVYQFQQYAREKIEEIHQKGKLPIIVGGTGLYIKACLYDYEFAEEGNLDESVKEYENYSNEELVEELKEVDPKALETIHSNNRKRLIRALVIAKLGKMTKTAMIEKQEHKLLYDAFIVGMTMDREQLYERINQRVEHMIKEGLEEEVRSLLEQYPNLFELRSMHGIGYKEWAEYFLGNQGKERTISLIQQHSRNFAKRQYTWFHNQMKVQWVNIGDEYKDSLIEKIMEWYHES